MFPPTTMKSLPVVIITKKWPKHNSLNNWPLSNPLNFGKLFVSTSIRLTKIRSHEKVYFNFGNGADGSECSGTIQGDQGRAENSDFRTG